MSRLLVSKCTEKKKLIFYFIEFLFEVKKLVVNFFGLQTSLTNWRVSVIRFHRKGGCCCWLTHCQNSFSIYLSKQCLKTTKKIVLLGWGCKGKKKQSHKVIMWVSKSVCEYFQLLIIPSAMHSIHMRSKTNDEWEEVKIFPNFFNFGKCTTPWTKMKTTEVLVSS